MKYTIKLLYIWIVAAATGCNNASDEIKIPYQAVAKSDTASLKIILKKKEFYGQLEVNYSGLYKDSGDVSGIVKGDTLKGSFYYQRYGKGPKRRIPIALLKKDHQLVMGIGEMEVYMNITFFKKGVPIDYQHSKFVFQRLH
ncbi:hypothetical protein HDE68_002720 [Pedobacter cryoconitis]|uniref:Lipoprotein n=1 Tax=Pedobacter cryoconitis TaxID=188932 RepID=A0A7W8ZMM7_9SPHI|nr:hypothetical protein [Pedobacter cryoconitis]MBB5636807.1 hypothetical protein [Pedobacter cryoconitis]